jgi:flagellar biosynthesis/type III secretory pathway chaperone
MYFEFDKKNDMASYLSLSYQAMENVLQELDAVVKDEFVSLPCAISLRKVESLAKKSMINQQVSLANQVLKNPKVDNAQHVLEIVELDDFDSKKMKVTKRQPLKCLKKTLLSLL